MTTPYKYINLQYLEEISDDCPEFLDEVIQLFKKQAVEYISILEKSVETDDYDAVKRVIHKAKSAMGVVGILVLSDMLSQFDARKLSIEDKKTLMDFSGQFKTITHLAIEELNTVLSKRQKK